MKAEVENPGIIFENVLGSVAVVHVPVNNRDPAKTMLCFEMHCRESNIVQQAESHGEIWFRVVSRRAHCTERGIQLTGCHQVRGFNH